MSATNFRCILIHLTANFNLILGGIALAFGVYVLVAGADAMATMVQAGDAGAEGLAKVAPAGDAKKAGDVIALASKGVGAVFMAMASIVAGCAIAQGLPFVLVGIGLLFHQGWARVFGILFGILGLLQGFACLGSPGGTHGVLVSGGVFLAYGILSLIALIGGSTAAYFARHQPADGAPPPKSDAPWAMAGIFASASLVALACGLVLSNPPRYQAGRLNVASKQTEPKLHGVWEMSGAEAHRLGFSEDGILYYSGDKGSSKGTYQLAAADSIDIEYELPEAIYLAQKAAFDLAKKAAGHPDNPFKALVSAVEPVRSVKDRVRFTLADGDKTLTLYHAKTPAKYKRSDTLLASIETKYDEQQAALAKLAEGKIRDVKDKKFDVDNFVPKIAPKDLTDAASRERLARLHDAIARGQNGRIRMIIQGDNVGVNDRDEKGETPVMKAVQSGYIDVVKELLNLGADWTVTDRQGHDLLYHAIAIGRFEWFVTNLGHGGNGEGFVWIQTSGISWVGHVTKSKTTKKVNGFMVAAMNGQFTDLKYMAGVMQRNNRLPDLKNASTEHDNDGKTALDHAQDKGHKHIVAWLEEIAGAKAAAVPLPDPKKTPTIEPSTDPAQLAFLKLCEAGDVDAIDAALRSAASTSTPARTALVTARGKEGMVPIMIAAKSGDSAFVLVLNKHMRECNQLNLFDASDNSGQTAFHHAVAKGNVEVVEILANALTVGWDQYRTSNVNWFKTLQRKDNKGDTPLARAEAEKRTEVVKFLRDYYTKTFARPTNVSPGMDPYPVTALSHACREGDVATVKQLLKEGSPIHPTTDQPPTTPLMEVMQRHKTTPLMEASSHGHVLIVKVLLDSFGDDAVKKREHIALRNHTNQSAVEYAAPHPEVRDLFDKHRTK